MMSSLPRFRPVLPRGTLHPLHLPQARDATPTDSRTMDCPRNAPKLVTNGTFPDVESPDREAGAPGRGSRKLWSVTGQPERCVDFRWPGTMTLSTRFSVSATVKADSTS